MKYDKLALEQALWDKRFTEDVKSGRLFWITNKSVIKHYKSWALLVTSNWHKKSCFRGRC